MMARTNKKRFDFSQMTTSQKQGRITTEQHMDTTPTLHRKPSLQTITLYPASSAFNYFLIQLPIFPIVTCAIVCESALCLLFKRRTVCSSNTTPACDSLLDRQACELLCGLANKEVNFSSGKKSCETSFGEAPRCLL